MQNIVTFDLGAFAANSIAKRQFPEIVVAIGETSRIHSLRTDALHAEECFTILDDIPVSAASESDALREHSLLCNAIVLYARAKTASSHRKSFDLRKRMNDDQRQVHKELCDLRDDAIAHFGPGKHFRGEWLRETVVLQFQAGKPGRVGGVSRRITMDKGLVKRGRLQTSAVRSMFEGLFAVQSTRLSTMINNAAEIDSKLGNALQDYSIDLGAYLGSRAAAMHAAGSHDVGQASGVIYHGP